MAGGKTQGQGELKWNSKNQDVGAKDKTYTEGRKEKREDENWWVAACQSGLGIF